MELDYVVAVPRMARYMEVSAKIYSVYLKYVSPDDIHVYSIDEVFIDATSYLKLYKLTARDFAMKMIRDVLQTTGITATAGIGPNMYLCKIAMDIEAKHIPADKDGVRIAELDERSYREKMWCHRPLTDFWRVGKGYASKLEAAGMYTMGDVARMSVKNEDLLYRMFGINAELLIDHAWYIIYGAAGTRATSCRNRDYDHSAWFQLPHRTQYRDQLPPAEVDLAVARIGLCG